MTEKRIVVEDHLFHTKYTDRLDGMSTVKIKPLRIAGLLSSAVFTGILLTASVYIVEEGYRGVVRTWGEVTDATKPGLHFKVPFIQTVDEIEIRPRRYELKMAAATTSRADKDSESELQMSSTFTITGNWSVDPESVRQVVSQYGSIQQFEDRILDPRVRETSLATIPQYTLEAVMTDRTSVSSDIFKALVPKLDGFPVTFTDIMISDVDFHPRIREAVLNKQDAKLKKEEEQYKLEKQNLEAQQKVNTANAEAAAIERTAEATAKATRLAGDAEAAAIKAKGDALRSNPNLIQLIHEERWNGQLPQFMTGSGSNFLFKAPDLN